MQLKKKYLEFTNKQNAMKSLRESLCTESVDGEAIYNMCLNIENDRKFYDRARAIIKTLRKKGTQKLSLDVLAGSSMMDQFVRDLAKETGFSLNRETRAEAKYCASTVIFTMYSEEYGEDIPNFDPNQHDWYSIPW